MKFQTPLVPGTLVRRYKRFLADVILDDGRAVTAHCANPGAMTGLKAEGLRVWLEPNDDPRKKLKFGWRLAELPDGQFAGIDTSLPNRIVKEALAGNDIAPLSAWRHIKPEVKYGQNSRVDFLLGGEGLPDHYVEVKNVHLCRVSGLAEFPDSRTERGTKHLRDLADMCRAGAKATMLYLVQRTDCRRMTIASDIDPDYATAFKVAASEGVDVLVYDTHISAEGISLRNSLPFQPPKAD